MSPALVVLGVVTAADVREVTGGGDMNWQLQARHAQRSCSVLHDLNRVCILFIFCISVSLSVDEVWRDTAWYWAQERGEGSTEFLVALVVTVLWPYCQTWFVRMAGGPHDHLLPA